MFAYSFIQLFSSNIFLLYRYILCIKLIWLCMYIFAEMITLKKLEQSSFKLKLTNLTTQGFPNLLNYTLIAFIYTFICRYIKHIYYGIVLDERFRHERYEQRCEQYSPEFFSQGLNNRRFVLLQSAGSTLCTLLSQLF